MAMPAAETTLASSFSRTLALSRSVFPKTGGNATGPHSNERGSLPESQFKTWLVELSNLRGRTVAVLAKRRSVLDSLESLIFSRMGMHRALFSPQWAAPEHDGPYYDSRFRPLDLDRDVLVGCSVANDELVAVVERKTTRATSLILTRTVRFPLRYLADDGESRRWADAAQRLQSRRAEQDAANTRFNDAESEVQALLACYLVSAG